MSTHPVTSVTPVFPHRPTNQLVALSSPDFSSNERIGAAIADPVLFAKSFLQTDCWDVQAEIMKAVADNPRVAVKACHASSKTFSAAIVLLWFLARYKEAVVVTTAPTWGQVEKLLWGEVHSALLRSRYPFPKATLTELKMGPKRYAYGLSTSVTKQDEGVKFQGIHAENVLVILDEAPGVDPKIWTAIEGARAGGNVKIMAIGNPTISSGPFHDAFVINRSGWTCFTIDAFDTPNFVSLPGTTSEEKLQALLSPTLPDEELDNNICPYLTTRRWVKEKFYEWGPEHPSWQARVRGQFPKQSEDALLSLTWLEQAAIRDLAGNGDLTAGLDVAGPGEAETSLTVRRGPKVIHHQQWPFSDPRGEVVNVLNKYKDELKAVNVDAVGIGWYIHKHLEDLKFPSNPVIAQAASSDSEKYANEKAEFYWGLRMRFESGDICGLTDETTIGQLAGIRYKHNARGQVEIESKEDAIKRGVRSPDRAESVMLAFASKIAIYGVLEVNKQETAEYMQKVEQSKMRKPVMVDNALTCPECLSSCVARTNGQWRCGNCGTQFSGPGDKQVIQRAPSRGTVLAKNSQRRSIELEH